MTDDKIKEYIEEIISDECYRCYDKYLSEDIADKIIDKLNDLETWTALYMKNFEINYQAILREIIRVETIPLKKQIEELRLVIGFKNKEQ